MANLEKAGRLRRLSDPTNARKQRLKLTDLGLEMLRESRERVRNLDQQLSAGLSPEEEQFLRRWLVQVARRD